MDRIWAHIIGGWAGDLGQAQGCKLVDVSVEYVREVRALLGPAALIIVRWVEDDQGRLVCQGAAGAREWYARRRPAMLAMAAGDPNVAFEGLNEIPDDLADVYCEFEVERLRLMHQDGLPAVVGNFSVGVPDPPVWAVYEPMLRAMGPRDLLGLHEYWVDADDLGNPWHVGRWRIVPRLQSVPTVVTECSRDTVEGRGRPGWQRTCSAEQILAELRRFGEIVEAAPQVVGACGFQIGSTDDKFRPFDLAPVWPRVVAGYSGTAPAWGTAVTPQPVEEVKPVGTRLEIDGRYLSVTEFAGYVAGLDLSGVTTVVMHNTVSPDVATWEKWGGWPYWHHGLRDYYESRGWTATPHLFVDSGGIGVLWPLDKAGRGIGGGAREATVRHIELVGNYATTLPVGNLLLNGVAAAAAVLQRAGLGIAGLDYHYRVVNGRWDCPGKRLRDNWGWFAGLVAGRLQQIQPVIEEPYLPEYVEAQVWDVFGIIDKDLWWTEEARRARERGDAVRAGAIELSRIRWLESRRERLRAD